MYSKYFKISDHGYIVFNTVYVCVHMKRNHYLGTELNVSMYCNNLLSKKIQIFIFARYY